MRGLFQGRTWIGDAQLPHPPIMEGVLKIVENAIMEAWQQVCEVIDSNGMKADVAYEDQFTEVLWKHLDHVRLQDPCPIPGFTPDQFESVQREGNWRDCENTSIDKQPDLVFKFYAKRPGVSPDSAAYDGLFIECKPIDRKHPIKKHYLDNGLSRFVNGTYAWAMQDAMMLGYACKGATLSNKLIPEISKPASQESLKMIGSLTRCDGDIAILNRCETHHNRDCIYQHTGEKAGPIRVRHLWLGYGSRS